MGSIASWAWNDWATLVLMVPGLFLALTGSVGVLRMPDFYTRLHPAGKSDTMAQGLILFSLMFQADDPMVMVKLGLLTALLFVTAPTATHAITKAAELDKNMPDPWTRGDEAEKLRWRAQPPIARTVEAPAQDVPASANLEETAREEEPSRSVSGELDTGHASEPEPVQAPEPEPEPVHAPEPEPEPEPVQAPDPQPEASSLFAPPSMASPSVDTTGPEPQKPDLDDPSRQPAPSPDEERDE